MEAELLERAKHIKLMIFDVDGVLTDGSLHFGPDGEMMKTFNVLDGHGIKLLQQSGVATAIISARQSPIVLRRATDLGIQYVQQGVDNKLSAFERLLAQAGVGAQSCGYVGDDVIDLPILLRAGLAFSVPNGHPEVTARVHYVTRAGGGRGAAREICDLIMRAQGNFDAILESYLT
jgi:3-deoxy-D-manno-octulosonate 8-phosphate phosphatase (KDO 8-P phosphatase)